MYDNPYLKTKQDVLHKKVYFVSNCTIRNKNTTFIENAVTHQANDKTCRITNNKARPKFFHCKRNTSLMIRIQVL